MAGTIKDQVCDVCGEPATNGACDMKQIPSDDGCLCFNFVTGIVRFGCAKHPQKSLTYGLDGNVITATE